VSWNLFVYEPRKCYHPALADFEEPANWLPAIVCRVGEANVVIFNLNAIVAGADGQPSSGHPYTPKDRVQLEFDAAANEWLVIEADKNPRTYRFALPDQELLKWFKDCRKHIPSFENMQTKADTAFDL